MKYLGVDGCKGGWVAAIFEDSNFLGFEKFPDITSIWSSYGDASCICIDIPIGLVDQGQNSRECDVMARKLLGPDRKSSVFPPPCRHSLGASSYQEACAINFKNTGRKISRQAWGILPKIMEVDTFLRSNIPASQVIREVHPEVCFWAFDKKPMTYNKKYNKGGFHERLALVQRFLPEIQEGFFCAERKRLKKVQYDDLMDALVAGLTASTMKFMTFLPHDPEHDSRGLPMRICYSEFWRYL